MKRIERFILAVVLVLGLGLTTACKDSTGPEMDSAAAWVQEPVSLYVYGFTGAQVMWVFFDANASATPRVTAHIIGGSSIKLIDTPTQPVFTISADRTRYRTDVVFTTLKTGITCFQLQVDRGPTTERCVAVSLSEKGNLVVEGM